jgi:hypothetical protein
MTARSPEVRAKHHLRLLWAAVHGPLRSEFPLLVIELSLLVVLLHANAPEVWFWFLLLLILLFWRSWAWMVRRRQRLAALAQVGAAPEEGSPVPPADSAP